MSTKVEPIAAIHNVCLFFSSDENLLLLATVKFLCFLLFLWFSRGDLFEFFQLNLQAGFCDLILDWLSLSGQC